MPFIPAVNTARVSVNQKLHGQSVRNVFHVMKGSALGEADLTSICNTFITWWNDDMAPHFSTDFLLESVSARDMTTADAIGVEIGAPALSGGNLAIPALPGNVALAVKHKSGFTGRNRNGRSFVSGIPETMVNGNEVTLVWRDFIVGAFGLLRDNLTADNFTHVVASFYDGTTLVAQGDGQIIKEPTPRATALLTPVLQYIAEINTDSQRRRLNTRGI